MPRTRGAVNIVVAVAFAAVAAPVRETRGNKIERFYCLVCVCGRLPGRPIE